MDFSLILWRYPSYSKLSWETPALGYKGSTWKPATVYRLVTFTPGFLNRDGQRQEFHETTAPAPRSPPSLALQAPARGAPGVTSKPNQE